MYTKEEKMKIDQVIDTFRPFIDTKKNEYGLHNYEIVWLEHMHGYLFVIHYGADAVLRDNDILVSVVESAEWLYGELVFEIANEVYHTHGFPFMQAEDITEEQMLQAQRDIISKLQPYLLALPEYRDVAMRAMVDHAVLYVEQ